MVRWVSKSQRINSGMDSDTGKRHTSRPPPHPSHVLRHFSAPIEVQRNVLVEKHFGLFHTNNSFISEDGVTSDKLSCSDFLQIFPNNKSLIILYGKHCVSAWLLPSSLHSTQYLATWQHVVLGYFNESLPVAVITCLQAAVTSAYQMPLGPTVWRVLVENKHY